MSSTENRKRRSRRAFLGTASAIAGTALLPRFAQATEPLVVTCWGGDYQKGIREIFADPFTKETGIPVTLVNNADLAKMAVQVQTKDVQWDVFDSIGPQITAGAKQGLWQDIDHSIVDTSDLIKPGGRTYVGTYYYGGGIAFDPKRVAPNKRPMDFAELWDAKKYPGRRGLRNRAPENLEMALVADGVAPDKLYPLDVDRAFKSMDRIKPYVKKWIETTPQTISLLTSDEIDFSYTYLSRVIPAQKAGLSVAISRQQMVNSLEYLAVPKYTRNRVAAMRYVAFCLRPDRQAAFANLLYFAPNSRKAQPMVEPASRRYMPDATNPANVTVDDAWWADHYDAVQKRFLEWLLT